MRVDAARLFGLAAACLAVWASHATAATTGIAHVTAKTPAVTARNSLTVR